MNSKPARPELRSGSWLRLRFSLKSVLLLTTIVCGWLGYNAHVVRHRQQLLREIEARDALLLCFVGNTRPAATAERLGPSTWRRWLGDVAHESIVLVDSRDLAAVRNAFPEAHVSLVEKFDPKRILDPGRRQVVPRIY